MNNAKVFNIVGTLIFYGPEYVSMSAYILVLYIHIKINKNLISGRFTLDLIIIGCIFHQY